ncbi:MAG: hypothetical protein ABI587_12870 [Gemmatimonadales bacterium]
MSRDALLLGVLHSLRTAEQRFLEACTLYNSGHFSGTVLLAILGQEELGRAGLLLARYDDASPTDDFRQVDLRVDSSHIERLAAGRAAMWIQTPKAITAGLADARDAGDKEEEERLYTLLHGSALKRAKREPSDLQRTREEVQYVEPTSAASWSSPWLMNQAEAYGLLHTAIFHLTVAWQGMAERHDLMAVWATMQDKPTVPPYFPRCVAPQRGA